MASFLGAKTVLTDLGDVLPILKSNVEANTNKYKQKLSYIDATVKDLFWGTDVSDLKGPESIEATFDYIIGADIIYEIQGFEELIQVNNILEFI